MWIMKLLFCLIVCVSGAVGQVVPRFGGVRPGTTLQDRIRAGLVRPTNVGFNAGFGPLRLPGLPMGPVRRGGIIPPPPLTPMGLLMLNLARNPNNYRYATCTFNDTWTAVKGRADFRQFVVGEGRQQVNVRVQLVNLPVSNQPGIIVERGIHVHEFGDIGDGCARVGPHYNPNQTPHGSPRNFAFLRHVGDLGNIRQSNEGLVSTEFTDRVISLEGVNSIVGRSLVITFERDDEGLGRTPDSLVNGNTHNQLACCTIGRTTARNWIYPMSEYDLRNMAMTGLMPDNSGMLFNPGQVVRTNIPVNTFPTRAGTIAGQPGTFPGTFTGQPGTFPTMTGTFTGQPGVFPTTANTVPGQPGMFPTLPGTFTGQPGTFPTIASTVPGQPGVFPTLPGTFTGPSGTFMNQPGMFNPATGTFSGTLTGQPGTQPGMFPGQPGTFQPQPRTFSGTSGTFMNQPGTFNPSSAGTFTSASGTSSGFGAGTFSGQPGTTGFSNTFIPGASTGQTFNFNTQGRKK